MSSFRLNERRPAAVQTARQGAAPTAAANDAPTAVHSIDNRDAMRLQI
jgi:hypothetical protein